MTPSPDLRYDTLREDDLSGFVDILGQAFHMPAERTRQAIEQAGLDAHRIIRRGGALAGGLRLILMGQWFGGACVPMAGVASVAVAPEHRRGGAATALMRSALEEMRDRRIPISVLYPTLASFYRKAGYEFAGVKISYEAPLTALDAGERDLAVTRVGPADRETLRALYDRRAQASAGNLDRPAYLWSRLLEPINQTAYAYLVGDAGKPDGYAIFTQEGWSKPIRASDVCVRSRAAALRLLTFFSDHRTTVSALEWTGGPEDALLHTLPEYSKKEARIWLWMLRVVDVAAALEARGYPPAFEAELHFEIQDDWLPWNNGRFVLQVSNGRGEVSPGGQGRLRMHVRRLAQLYTGHLSPGELRVVGDAEGPPADWAAAGLAFSGPRPWMADLF